MSLRALSRRPVAIGIAVALWVPAVAVGLNILWSYSNTPGRAAEPPLDFPHHAGVTPSRERATLLMFVHPRCPCSDASIGELAKLVASDGAKLDTSIFFFYPRHETPQWAHGELWTAAAAIPGVRVFDDKDGEIARRFGALTSGQTLLYTQNGRLRFRGGITASRGHSGDNAGRSAISALLSNHQAVSEPIVTPVFGCSLTGE